MDSIEYPEKRFRFLLRSNVVLVSQSLKKGQTSVLVFAIRQFHEIHVHEIGRVGEEGGSNVFLLLRRRPCERERPFFPFPKGGGTKLSSRLPDNFPRLFPPSRPARRRGRRFDDSSNTICPLFESTVPSSKKSAILCLPYLSFLDLKCARGKLRARRKRQKAIGAASPPFLWLSARGRRRRRSDE